MKGLHDDPDDATLLTPEERDELIPSHVTLRRELNELEQQNILNADVARKRERELRAPPAPPHVRRGLALGWDL